MVWRVLQIVGVMMVAKGLGRIEPLMTLNERMSIAMFFFLGVAFVITSVVIRSEDR